MNLSKKQEDSLIQELIIALSGRMDGGRKNIISDCPYCGKSKKFGVFIGKETGRKKKFASNCFSCGNGSRELAPLLEKIERLDLLPNLTTNVDDDIEEGKKLWDTEDDLAEVDDELVVIDMPDGYEAIDDNGYLEERGFEDEDYEYFEVGKSSNFKFENYVIFPIYDDEDIVGYVSRHIWSKKKLERFNKAAKQTDSYQILRYRNSNENEFVKLLYNIDNVIEDQTLTVILVEGIFDVIALTRELNLYDNPYVTAVATLGKKISDVQIYKLQQKGVENVIIGYDPDAVNTIKQISSDLDKYFNCMIADIPDVTKDFDDLDFWEMFDVFKYHLKTPREYNLTKLQQTKLKG